MGIKEAKEWFTQLCVVVRTLSQLRGEIVRERGDDDYVPIIGVDVSVWIRAALGNPRKDSIVSAQYHAKPSVPVMAVVDYILKRAAILTRAGFIVILVFDGQRNPLKGEENENRQARLDLKANEELLQKMYTNEQSYSTDAVLDLRKKLLYPRPDITYEVLAAARRNRPEIYIACAPFETDHQMKALQEQDLLDAAISTDSDLIALGIRRTIASSLLDSKLEVRDYNKLTTEVLPQLFEVEHAIVGRDLAFLCNMLGNDNLPGGLYGSGKADVIKRMKEYLGLTESRKANYIIQYCMGHGDPQKFAKSMWSWGHSPVYKIIPRGEHCNARSAFFAGEFNVKLCSMSLDESETFEPAQGKLGYIPEEQIRHGHTPSEPSPPTHIDFFLGLCWSRTGDPFAPVPAQFNGQGDEVIPGAIIDFDKVPMKYISSRALETWLTCRGVPTPSLENRQELEDMVDIARRYKVDALPKLVMRSGGGCVTASVMSFDNEEEAIWLTHNDALAEIRSNKCACVEDSKVLENLFELQHNSKRDRCLNHLKSGSFDLKDVKVSLNLKSDMLPGEKLFAISFMCAPSQRGLGTEKKMYPVQLVFHLRDDGSSILLPAPFSFCHCPVGIGFCAHKGGCVLMLAAIRDFFKEHDFDALVVRLPPNIHSVAGQSYLVRQIFPPLESQEHALDRRVSTNDDDDDEAGYRSDNSGSESQRTSSSDDQRSDDVMLERVDRFLGSTTDDDTGKMALKDLLAEVKSWCKSIEVRLQASGTSHKVNTDVGKSECEKAAQIESDEAYLKRRNIRWQRLVRSVRAKTFPDCMLSYYCEDVVGDLVDIDNLSRYMEYNEDKIYPY